MNKWLGSAGICINDSLQVLMVKQGQVHEEKLWSVPSGGKEEEETYEECCVREILEETGYESNITEKLHVKKGVTFGIPVEVHYFKVEVIGGEMRIQDPDGLIYEIDWKSAEDIQTLEMSFPEDRELLLQLINEEKRS